jgi:monoamine oxidase
VDALTARFGSKAKTVADYREHDWGAEDYSRGGYMAHTSPGALTGFGRSLREPCGAIHWAGTETSTVSHGSFDGAIRSGVRAADEILTARSLQALKRQLEHGAGALPAGRGPSR